jgi:ABC-type Fe3+-hydroxamate transport system substrate-binding protein
LYLAVVLLAAACAPGKGAAGPEPPRRVGGFSGAQVSVEQVAALKPDLVILSDDMHFRVKAMLEDLGIRTLAVEPRNMAERDWPWALP